ncbi:MAG: RNA polymerase sigma factor RpoD/SigA [Spirochaetes bacterium]|nr:RNA polymerase sigma factor RpoD/SigA [Brevinematales bacterium]MCL1960104.1 RNA polymerase sigma factor RpoD/SigA [Spirochaetota bacterium]
MQKKASKSNDSLLDTYFKQIKVFPLLTFEDELELSRQIQEGNTEALHKLVNSNLRLVAKIAGLYSMPDIPILDIIQEGNMGLIHAAGKFDYQKNVRFCTYASWWIRQFISRYISKKRRFVRLPQRKEEALRKIQYVYHSLCQTLMHQPQNTDIARELGISVQDVDFIVNMASDSLPFEQTINDDETVSTIDVHEDYTYNPERTLMKKISRDSAMNILNKLKDKERRILNYRYQLNGCERHTLREIGDKLDISPETVRQIEMRALKKIRNHANELKECVYVEAI